MSLTTGEMSAADLAAVVGNRNDGFGFGGDGAWWIILLFLVLGNGWGGGFGGFGGGYGNMYEFPWLMNGQQGINSNTNAGFQNAMLNDGITSIRDGISGLSTQLCDCCGNMQMALANGFANAETAANARQIANMQTAFAGQTAMAQGFNGVQTSLCNGFNGTQTGLADLKYTVATENCADRAALNEGVRDIIANQTAGIQTIMDKLCDQELQAERRENANLRQELLFARGQASQIAQNQTIVDNIYNRLDTCPVGTTPVYGRTPIFSCTGNSCGCGAVA